jgi:CheY-like chemotaxis protein
MTGMGRILVVDDDEAMQQTIATILEDEGYQVVCAANGREALTQLEQEAFAPQLILLDLAMPALDGYAFAEELERRGLRPGLPVVIITADGRAPQKAERVGADGYLTKPFSLTALVAEVSRLLPTDAA